VSIPQISHTVEELLLQHECVIVPGLGGFLMRSFQASANPFSKELRPSGQSVFFNAALTQDDGLVAKHWAEQKGLTYAAAVTELKSIGSEILEQAKDKKPVPFGRMGQFFLNPQGQLFFIPAQSLNLSLEHFGLPALRWQALESVSSTESVAKTAMSIPLTTESIDIEDAEVAAVAEEWTDKLEQKLQRNPIWKVAANVVLVMVIAALLVLNVRTFQKAYQNRVDEQAGLQLNTTVKPAPQKQEAVAAKAESEKSTLKYELGTEGIDAMRVDLYQQSGDVFICGGSYITPKMAETECLLWQKLGYDATYIEMENSSLTRVVLARFVGEKEASDIAKNIKNLAAGRLSVEYVFPAPVL
jgi:hypothetical protein